MINLSKSIQFCQKKEEAAFLNNNKKGCLALLLFLSLLALLFTLSQKKIKHGQGSTETAFKRFGFGRILRPLVDPCTWAWYQHATPPMKILHEKIIAWREKEDYE